MDEEIYKNTNTCKTVPVLDFYNVTGLLVQLYLIEKIVSLGAYYTSRLRGFDSYKVPIIALLILISTFFALVNLASSYLAFKENDHAKKFKYVSGVMANSVFIAVFMALVAYLSSTTL
ncbi:hypothetical protein ACFL0C_00945 [Patescibacteria group bacterium]